MSLKVTRLSVLNSTGTVYVVFVLLADIQVSYRFMGKYRVNVHFLSLFIHHGSNSSKEETEGRLEHLFSHYQASAESHRSIIPVIATDGNTYLYFQETKKKIQDRISLKAANVTHRNTDKQKSGFLQAKPGAGHFLPPGRVSCRAGSGCWQPCQSSRDSMSAPAVTSE